MCLTVIRGTDSNTGLPEKGRDLQPVLLAMVAWGDKWGAAAKHPPPQLSDQNGDPVELRVVNTRTGRRVPRYTVRMLPTKGATDPNMVPPKDIRSRATRQHA